MVISYYPTCILNSPLCSTTFANILITRYLKLGCHTASCQCWEFKPSYLATMQFQEHSMAIPCCFSLLCWYTLSIQLIQLVATAIRAESHQRFHGTRIIIYSLQSFLALLSSSAPTLGCRSTHLLCYQGEDISVQYQKEVWVIHNSLNHASKPIYTTCRCSMFSLI